MKSSFNIPITLWVYGHKVQTEALVDSGATTNFLDRRFVEKNHLVTTKLATPYKVTNADGTPNKSGRITHYVRTYLGIGTHCLKHLCLITDLDKAAIMGYTFLYKHNPEIDWRNGEWEFTRCPDTCHREAHKSQRPINVAELYELSINLDLPWESSLEDFGSEDPENPYINWVAPSKPKDHTQAAVIASLVHDEDEIFPEDDVDTKN